LIVSFRELSEKRISLLGNMVKGSLHGKQKACGSSEEEAVSMENRAAEMEEDLASTAVCEPLCSRIACTTDAAVGVSYVSSPMCPSDRPDCVCLTNVHLECSECGRSYPM
jgi:hypothetical protein